MALAIGSTEAQQVRVQKVKEVHSVVLQDNAMLHVYIDKKRGNELEVGTMAPVAKVTHEVMTIGDDTKAVLRLASDCSITTFTVQDNATLILDGPIDFGDCKLSLTAEDNANVTISTTFDTTDVVAGSVSFETWDNASIVSKKYLHVGTCTLKAVNNSLIKVPDIRHTCPGGDSTRATTRSLEVYNNGRIVIEDQGEEGVINAKYGDKIITHMLKKGNHVPSRDTEFKFFWGFQNWGSTPLAGMGGVEGGAEVSYNFMHGGLSLDFPVFNRRHFGIYVGLGFDMNGFHFSNSLVNYTQNGFRADTVSSMAPLVGSDPDSWNTYFSKNSVILPITLSFEPWKRDGLCLRLSVLPGFSFGTGLYQHYKSHSMTLNANDSNSKRQLNPFRLDARMEVYYNAIGVYVQTSLAPILKPKAGNDRLYPVMFGLVLALGR